MHIVMQVDAGSQQGAGESTEPLHETSLAPPPPHTHTACAPEDPPHLLKLPGREILAPDRPRSARANTS